MVHIQQQFCKIFDFVPIASAFQFCKADVLELQGGVETNEDGYLADETEIDFAILQFFGVERDGEMYDILYIMQYI